MLSKLSKLSLGKEDNWDNQDNTNRSFRLIPVHRAQLFNYMRLLKKPCGILVNFAPKFATIERYLFDIEEGNIKGMDGSVIHRL